MGLIIPCRSTPTLPPSATKEHKTTLLGTVSLTHQSSPSWEAEALSVCAGSRQFVPECVGGSRSHRELWERIRKRREDINITNNYIEAASPTIDAFVINSSQVSDSVISGNQMILTGAHDVNAMALRDPQNITVNGNYVSGGAAEASISSCRIGAVPSSAITW